ncbi:hypothetical protein N657DRAFT_202480 [Parathielavia appendiculata]|uniref:Uncharacterized protein n=1 Tax=Parathielavia appendiculata TaxID=2587402 RepID=A0AAN6Z690_9PEZI|nr:hypothetical protein N657DRAFT_202480 [Parathielavia appendiculata]
MTWHRAWPAVGRQSECPACGSFKATTRAPDTSISTSLPTPHPYRRQPMLPLRDVFPSAFPKMLATKNSSLLTAPIRHSLHGSSPEVVYSQTSSLSTMWSAADGVQHSSHGATHSGGAMIPKCQCLPSLPYPHTAQASYLIPSLTCISPCLHRGRLASGSPVRLSAGRPSRVLGCTLLQRARSSRGSRQPYNFSEGHC